MHNKHLRVLVVVNDLTGGHGWSACALSVVNAAVAHGDEIFVITENEKPKNSTVDSKQFSLLSAALRIPWHPLRLYQEWKKIQSVIDKVQPDVIHVISEPYIQAFAFAGRLDVPIVLTVHGTHATIPETVPNGVRRWISQLIFSRVLKRVSAVISVSERTKNVFLGYTSGFKRSVYVIHNSISIPETIPQKHSDRDEFHVTTVGEVKRRKGISESISLFSEWAQMRNKKIVYNVVGSFDEQQPYVMMVKKMARERQGRYFEVVFHGRVDKNDKVSLLQKTDLYTHLEPIQEGVTDVEGFGISIIEAAAYGVPALVAKDSATVEAVQEGKSGFSIDLHDPKSAYATIDTLLLEQRIVREDVLAWAALHSPETMYKEIRNVYMHAINNK